MPIEGVDTAERRATIERMIEEYGMAKQGRLLERAMRLWREAEVDRFLVQEGAATERVH